MINKIRIDFDLLLGNSENEFPKFGNSRNKTL